MGLNNNKNNKKSSKEKKGSGEVMANNGEGGNEENNGQVHPIQPPAQSPARKTIARKQKVTTPPKKALAKNKDRRRSIGSRGSGKMKRRKPKRTFKFIFILLNN